MLATPPDQEPPSPGAGRPRFQNVISTGNVVGIVTTLVTVLPVLALIYGAGAWVSTVQSRFDAFNATTNAISLSEISDRRDLDAVRRDLVTAEGRLEAELSLVRERLAVLDGKSQR